MSKLTNNAKQLIAVTIAATLNLLMSSTAMAASPDMEKCLGIVKKGMNDCASNNHPCQGQATTDSDMNDWILVPKGSCEKIVQCKKS